MPSLRRQPLKQGPGSLHIRGRKTFGEPIINRSKRGSRLMAATLAHPQTGNAEGDPQLPKQSALLASHFGRLIKAIFGRQGGLIRGLPEQHFAFDAEQLRGIPPVPVPALTRGRHRVVQGTESLVEPPCSGKPQRESALELRIRHAPPGSVARLERIAQHQQALRELAAFDQQLPFQEVTRVFQKRAFKRVATSIKRAISRSAVAKSPIIVAIRQMP